MENQDQPKQKLFGDPLSFDPKTKRFGDFWVEPIHSYREDERISILNTHMNAISSKHDGMADRGDI